MAVTLLSNRRQLCIPPDPGVVLLDPPLGGLPWYNAGGCPNPIACWQPKAADGWNPANIAASYVNRVNPGTYDAFAGVAPAWAAATGWTGNGLTTFLRTGLVPQSGHSLLVRFNSGTNAGYAVGVMRTAGGNTWLGLQPARLAASVSYISRASQIIVAPQLLGGTLLVTGTDCFRNGVDEGNIAAGGAAGNTRELYLLCLNLDGVAVNFYAGIVTAIAEWAVEVAAYAAALHARLIAVGL